MYQNAPSISYLTFPKLNSIALFSFYYISFEILMSSQQIQPNGIRVDSESSFAKLVSSTFSGPVIAIDNPPVIWRELWLDLNAKGTMRTTQVPKCIQAISTIITTGKIHTGAPQTRPSRKWIYSTPLREYMQHALFLRH